MSGDSLLLCSLQLPVHLINLSICQGCWHNIELVTNFTEPLCINRGAIIFLFLEEIYKVKVPINRQRLLGDLCEKRRHIVGSFGCSHILTSQLLSVVVNELFVVVQVVNFVLLDEEIEIVVSQRYSTFFQSVDEACVIKSLVLACKPVEHRFKGLTTALDHTRGLLHQVLVKLFDSFSRTKVDKPIKVVCCDPAHRLTVHLLVTFVEKLRLNHQIERLDASCKIRGTQFTPILVEVVVNCLVKAVGRLHNICDCLLVEVASKVWRLFV